jgi:hypothetical protein
MGRFPTCKQHHKRQTRLNSKIRLDFLSGHPPNPAHPDFHRVDLFRPPNRRRNTANEEEENGEGTESCVKKVPKFSQNLFFLRGVNGSTGDKLLLHGACSTRALFLQLPGAAMQRITAQTSLPHLFRWIKEAQLRHATLFFHRERPSVLTTAIETLHRRPYVRRMSVRSQGTMSVDAVAFSNRKRGLESCIDAGDSLPTIIQIVHKDSFDGWLESQPESIRNWLAACDFKGKDGSVALLPGEQASQ